MIEIFNFHGYFILFDDWRAISGPSNGQKIFVSKQHLAYMSEQICGIAILICLGCSPKDA